MELEDKEVYDAPLTLVVEVRSEGVVCASGGPFNGYHHDGSGNEDYNW